MKEYLEKIGKEGEINLNGLTVRVKIQDVKRSYGKIRYHVTPVTGSGDIWTENVVIN